MRRRTLLGGAVGLALAGCSVNAGTQASPTPSATSSSAGEASGRALLAYFSRPGENYFNGGRIDLDIGNTQVVAEMITQLIKVDTYRIVEADPYPSDYEQTVQRNVREEESDARPKIKNPLPDAADVETLIIGCPVWNVQTPMIMRTFVEALDLDGVVVHPFVTYAVSGMGRVRSRPMRCSR